MPVTSMLAMLPMLSLLPSEIDPRPGDGQTALTIRDARHRCRKAACLAVSISPRRWRCRKRSDHLSNHIAWNVRVHRTDERCWNERAHGELIFTGGQLTPRVEITG